MKAPTALLSLLATLAVSTANAQNEAFTDPVGFNSVTCLPNSDTICGVPFAQNTAFQGVISGTPTVNAGQAVITAQGTPAWAANQYQTFYFARLLTGAKAGMYFQIVANDAGTLTVDLAGDATTVSGVTTGDSFRIHRFWTLATLFPPATQTTFVASTSLLGGGRRSELLMPDLVNPGFNLAPTNKFFIFGGVWRKSDTGNPVADNEILWPDSYFIVRHNHASITVATTYTPIGLVETNAITTPLSTQTGGLQDNFVLSGRPIPIKLKDLDLVSSGAFVASTSLLGGGRRDTLLIFNNAVAAINKAPTTTYFYFSGTWRKADTGNPVADDDEVLPSHGLIIRKYQTAGGSTSYWTNTY